MCFINIGLTINELGIIFKRNLFFPIAASLVSFVQMLFLLQQHVGHHTQSLVLKVVVLNLIRSNTIHVLADSSSILPNYLFSIS